jgi:sterol desaturase/sphingolipid hydroxylase (fatty acid hydroxylase superfamily)
MTAHAVVLRRAQRAFERATRSSLNYRIVPIVDVAGAVLFLTAGLRAPIAPGAKAFALVAGLAAWAPIEYGLHRWLGHGPPTFARRGHAMHHADDEAPVAAPVFVVLGHVLAIWIALTLVMPAGLASLFVGGVYVGYNYYTLVHHLLHHREALVVQLGWRRVLQRHRLHHANHDVNFGVTSGFCDRLFGTLDSGVARSFREPAGRR